VLGLLLLRPDESFHVREIGRLTGVAAGSLHRELKLLADAGLLSRTIVGNQVRYRVDRSCPIYPELSGILCKTAGLGDMLHDALAPFAGKIAVAFVFGSVARAKEGVHSDIDLLVVGSISFTAVVQACNSARERLGRDVNPVVMTRSAFQTKYKRADRFVARIANGPKIFVVGDADEFGKLVKRSKRS
jgi:predicted nucleotidyltransferase